MKYLMFFMTDFVEVVVVAGAGDDAVLRRLAGARSCIRDGFHFPGGAIAARCRSSSWRSCRSCAFIVKVLFFCWFQILMRWTLPRFRYDQLMHLGWKRPAAARARSTCW